MSASKSLNNFLKTALIPELKKLGFTAKGRVLKRPKDDAVQIIEFLNWKYNDAESARFTVEVGVCFPGILEEVAQVEEFSFYRPYLENPEIVVCSRRERLGMFMQPAQDHWWTITALDGVTPNPAEILEPLFDKAIPWLNVWSSLDYYVNNGKPGDGQLGIAAYAACGQRDEAIAAAHRFAERRHAEDDNAKKTLTDKLLRMVDAVQASYGLISK